MEIILSQEMGFCKGVRRALRMVEAAAQNGQVVRTLGDIVHNTQVVERLRQLGVEVVSGFDEVKPGEAAMVTAHGVSPDVLAEAEAKNIALIDATCPLVKRVQRLAQEMAEAGYGVIICGDPGHAEVRGILGYAGENAVAGRSMAETRAYASEQEQSLPWQSRRRIAVLFQTTQREEIYQRFVADLSHGALAHIQEMRVFNTVCAAVARREPAARELAQAVDTVIVVGGRHSANTRHLAETCASTGVPTYHIEQADELAPGWFEGIQRVGVTAGTSTPDEIVSAVVQRLRLLGGR